MRRTVREIAAQACADLNEDLSANALNWVRKRYAVLGEEFQLAHLREICEVVLPATITAGTVTATAGSREITGNSTAQAAWSSDIVGRFIRLKTVWHEIEGLQGGNVIRLKSPYAETTASGSGYVITPRHVRLRSDIRFANAFVNLNQQISLNFISVMDLQRIDASRTFSAGGPVSWTAIGTDADGTRIVEFYPPAATSTLIGYVGYRYPERLEDDALIPASVNPEDLLEGVKFDVMQFRMAKALDENKVEKAAVWRNEARTQETIWNRVKEKIKRQDRMHEDIHFVMSFYGFSQRQVVGDYDIRNAYDQVWRN